MSRNAHVPAARAMEVADGIVGRLRPVCDRIEIAGSLRRGNKYVGDIEVVAIPKVGPRPDLGLFAEPGSLLDPELTQMVADGVLFPVKQGDRFKQYQIRTTRLGLNLDLFLTDAAGWGYTLAIRTGPWDYSRHIVTQRFKGGALDNDHRCHDGHVWRALDALLADPHAAAPSGQTTQIDGLAYVMAPVPEEADFFELVKGGYVPPEKRRYR